MTNTLLILGGLLGLLFPAGALLWAAAGLRSPERESAMSTALPALAVGLVGYLAVGFAFAFGGAGGLYPALGDLAALKTPWTPLAPWLGAGWPLAGGAGFLLSVGDDAGAYALFFLQGAFLVSGLALLTGGLSGRVRTQGFFFLLMLCSWLIIPLATAWAWGGGWLARLGANRALGHGFVDAGGAGVILVTVGAAVLAAALAGPREEQAGVGDDLPLAGSVGALAMAAGWVALSTGWALAGGTRAPLVAANLLAAASAGCAAAVAYMAFTTSRMHGAMAARGLLAGLVAGSAAAPFVGPATAALIGAIAGLLVCVTTYVVARLRLNDRADLVSVFLSAGLWGLLATGIFADGRSGQGWNGVGLGAYLGASGQGVSGLFPAAGFAADPGQLAAQAVGCVALFIWGFLPVFGLLKLVDGRRPSRQAAEESEPA